MKRIFAGLVLLAGVIVAGVATATPVAATVHCPDGTLHPGKEVDSLAQCNFDDEDASSDLMTTVKGVINFVLGILGVVAVVVIILGGFTLLTSQGESAKITKGKATILYGVIGLIVALLAFAIVNFVLSGVFGAKTDSNGDGDSDGGDNGGKGHSALVIDNYKLG